MKKMTVSLPRKGCDQQLIVYQKELDSDEEISFFTEGDGKATKH
jgi:hypothetical protein